MTVGERPGGEPGAPRYDAAVEWAGRIGRECHARCRPFCFTAPEFARGFLEQAIRILVLGANQTAEMRNIIADLAWLDLEAATKHLRGEVQSGRPMEKP